jgi:hypothetical protein
MRFLLTIMAALLVATGTAKAQSTVTAQIHNAPGWVAGTFTYHVGPPTNHKTRVNNGAAWNGTAYTAGLALNNYELLDPGSGEGSTCTSVSGPTGTGSNITDGGTCHWKYIGPVDYVTFTGFGFDNGSVWATGTDYGFLDVTHTTDTNLPVFQQLSPGCHSTIKPTTSNVSTQLTDGCYWLGTMASLPLSTSQVYLTYTSNTASMPMSRFNRDTFQGTVSGTTLCVTTPPATIPLAVNQYINWASNTVPYIPFTSGIQITSTSGTCGAGTPYTISSSVPTPYTGTFFASDVQSGSFGTSYQFNVGNVWNDREYVGGANGEANPIQTWNHNYQYNDGYHALLPLQAVTDAGYGWGYPTTIQAAVGESFMDTYAANPGLALAGYNANYGVGFRGVGVEGFGPSDNNQFITGFQFKSDTDLAVRLEARSGNQSIIHHNILEAGVGAPQVVNTGFDVTFYNNLLIAHGNTIGIQFDYGGFAVNNTIVCISGTCQSAFDNTVNWINENGTTLTNNLVFGFNHFVSSIFYNNQDDWHTCTWYCVTWNGSGNITDVSSTDGVGFDSCTFTPTGFTPCGSIAFANFSFTSWAMPFKTGYTYFSSGAGTNVTTCGNTYGFGTPNPGTCDATYSVSPSTVFAAWPGNYKILNTGAAYGAGAAFPGFGSYYVTFNTGARNTPCAGVWAGCNPNANTPDLFGNVRPVSSRYDAGAVQFGGAPPVLTTPGRFPFRW